MSFQVLIEWKPLIPNSKSQQLTYYSLIVLLQVIALASAADQKVLGKDNRDAHATKPDSAAETDIGLSEHKVWNPYQNGKSS